MVAVNSIIDNDDFNSIQSDVASIMGQPTGTHGNPATNQGYGQALESAQVGAGDVVTALDLQKLFLDLYRGRAHQDNLADFVLDQTVDGVEAGQIIGADASGDDLDNLDATNRGFNDFEAEATRLVARKNLVDSNYISSEPYASKTRSSAWGFGALTTITHVINITFPGQTKSADSGAVLTLNGADHARAFFNAGGQIRWRGSRSDGAAHSKNTDWTNLLADIGTVCIDRDNVFLVNGDTNNTTITQTGWYETSAASSGIIVERTGSTYTVNKLVINTQVNNATNPNELSIVIQFIDDDDDFAGNDFAPPVDPSVDGTLISGVEIYLPQDNDALIDIDAPTINTNAPGTDL
jgi:hypothetical protein